MPVFNELLDSFTVEMWISIVSVAIASLALILSVAVAWSNRKTLQVELSKNLEILEGGSMFFFDNDGLPCPYDDALLLYVEVVNPSPKDIAFFDMRAFDARTNINFPLLTRRAVEEGLRDRSLWRVLQRPDDEPRLSELIIPETNYGVFKANSFTRFHVVIFPSESTEYVFFSLKVAMRAFFVKDVFAVTGRKKFKFFGKKYDIRTYTKERQQSPPPEPSPLE